MKMKKTVHHKEENIKPITLNFFFMFLIIVSLNDLIVRIKELSYVFRRLPR